MKRRGAVAATLAVAAALLVVGVGWACPVQLATGHPCPTCGITRATRLIFQGDLAAATRLHPLVWLAVPVVALLVTVELVGYARTGAFGASRRMRGSNALMIVTTSLLFALWIARFFGLLGGPIR